MPATGMLPELNRSSASCTTPSATATVMLFGAICSVPERCRRAFSSPPVSFSICSLSCFAPREVANSGAD